MPRCARPRSTPRAAARPCRTGHRLPPALGRRLALAVDRRQRVRIRRTATGRSCAATGPRRTCCSGSTPERCTRSRSPNRRRRCTTASRSGPAAPARRARVVDVKALSSQFASARGLASELLARLAVECARVRSARTARERRARRPDPRRGAAGRHRRRRRAASALRRLRRRRRPLRTVCRRPGRQPPVQRWPPARAGHPRALAPAARAAERPRAPLASRAATGAGPLARHARRAGRPCAQRSVPGREQLSSTTSRSTARRPFRRRAERRATVLLPRPGLRARRTGRGRRGASVPRRPDRLRLRAPGLRRLLRELPQRLRPARSRSRAPGRTAYAVVGWHHDPALDPLRRGVATLLRLGWDLPKRIGAPERTLVLRGGPRRAVRPGGGAPRGPHATPGVHRRHRQHAGGGARRAGRARTTTSRTGPCSASSPRTRSGPCAG